MAPKNLYNSKRYHNYLRRQRYSIRCPYCTTPSVSVIVKDFESHCSLQHDLNSKLCCVWCQGTISWPEGCKCDYADHLQTCLRSFIALYRIETVSSEPHIPSPPTWCTQPERMNLSPLSAAETFFDYADGEMSRFDYTLEHFQLLESQPPLLQYPCLHTNLALSYLTSFLESWETHDWIHVMIKLVAYPSFVRALIQDQGQTRTLRFSCWCDGGKYGAERHRQHRHLILTAPRGHFQKHFWGKVMLEDPEDKPCSNFPCKRAKPIENALHFVNTLGYLSHRKSRCKFSFREEEEQEAVSLHHFYIFTSLPIDYRRILVGCWEGGLSQLLYMEKFQHISVPRLTEKPIVFQHGQWKQKMKDFYNLPLGQVLPVEKRFMPTTQATPYTYHLMNGRKLYFTSDPEHETLSEEEWLQKQVAGGNCFYETIGEHFWTPRPKDQARLNEIMPFVHRIQKLEAETMNLNNEIAGLKRHFAALEEELSREVKKWKSDEGKQVIQIIQSKIQAIHFLNPPKPTE